jgi:hypothetical protein
MPAARNVLSTMVFLRNIFARLRPWLVLGGAALLAPGLAHGQADSLQDIAPRFASYAGRTPVEKLFMHLDRPSYVSGEALWFKLYAVEGTTLRPLAASTVAYVEVLNPNQEPVLQAKIALHQASGHGSLVLPASLPSGRYTVRAYTSWMKNMGPAFYFQTPITVVDTRQALGSVAAPLAAGYDAQFFPEGGYLVQGLGSTVGFKLTDKSGRGVAATGTVLDEAGANVGHFSTLWAGMGSFAFTPSHSGAAYRAVIKLANNQTITYPLPAVRPQGYVLHLEATNSQLLYLVAQAKGTGAPAETLYLLGHAGQQVVLAAEGLLYNGQAVFTVPKRRLAGGITHFTLFNSRHQPLCERLYFRPPAATLALRASADKSAYASREKVTLQVAPAGPQPANLSVAVYQLDSLSAAGGADISSYLWLAADLKGHVEDPSRYLAPTPEAAQAADNLMLTQGWSRFRWADVLADQPAAPTSPPEMGGHLLRGRVVNSLTGAPAPGVLAYLAYPSRHVQLANSLSKTDGSVQFELPNFYGPRQLVLQCEGGDSLHRVELFSPFSADASLGAAPLTLTERVAASLRRRHVQAEVQQYYFGNQPVRYTLPPADSIAFYGKPSERYLLDKYTRFKVMEEVLREYVPGVLVRTRKDGFHFLVPDYEARETMENPLVLLDGVPVFDTNRIMAFDPLKVRQLDVVTNHYFLGQARHNGLVSFRTYHGDLAGFTLPPHALLQEYEGLQGQREFYAPRYDTPAAAQSRLPDFRNLLYWNPTLQTGPGAGTTATFFTSDQVGRYRVVVQGLTADGLTGSTSFTFEVKAPL